MANFYQILLILFLIVSTVSSAPLERSSPGETNTTSLHGAPLSSTVPTRTFETQSSKVEKKLPFLRAVDDMNRQEFFAIIQNEMLSKAEIWEGVEKWAKKQTEDVQADVLEFHHKLSEHVDNSKLRVEKIIKGLPEALRKLSEIVQDVGITRIQEKNRIANLYSSLDDDISKTLQYIVQLVSYAENEGKVLERKVKLRKLKQGGIWTGSVQASNIV